MKGIRKSILSAALLVALVLILMPGISDSQSERSKDLIKFETSMGDILIEVDYENAPITAKNFVQYVEDGFYDGLVFHRVINGFMVQGGGMDADMKERATREPIQNEADNGLKNVKYSLAMARTQDPHSASAQFFINVADNAFLDHKDKSIQGWGYAVFGKVVEGTEVVDKIKAVKTGRKGFHDDVPVEPVMINKATVQ